MATAIYQSAFEDDTLRYIDGLQTDTQRADQFIDTLPLPDVFKQELRQTWRITRQKLTFFRRELERSEGELAEELRVLHHALLPEVINYHVRLGELMIADHCDDTTYLQQWQSIWRGYTPVRRCQS